MRRAACLATGTALAVALALGGALAQQAPEQTVPGASPQGQVAPGQLEPGQDVTGQSVPLETGPRDETVPQPRFEAAPKEQDEPAPQPRFVRAPGTNGIEVSPLAPPGAEGGADASAGVATVPQQPSVLAPRGPEDTTVIDGDSGGRAAARASRFKSAPREISRPKRPTGPAIPIDAAPTELRQGVRLRELDKMTGQTETFELAVGKTRQVDRLKIRLEACRSPQGNDTHGTMAFLKVWDIREPDIEQFSGWMFAESPSLSALDHPRYDLWVISCTTSSIAQSSPKE